MKATTAIKKFNPYQSTSFFQYHDFSNFLNMDWGKQKFVQSNVGLLRTETAGPDPEFTFDTALPGRLVQLDDAGIQSSRWQAQVGLRYIFN